MLTLDELRETLAKPGLTHRDSLLLLLAVDDANPKSVRRIRELGMSIGLRSVQRWNVSSILSASRGLVVHINGGWLLTERGRIHLQTKGLASSKRLPVKQVLDDLYQHMAAIEDVNARRFLEEAAKCLEIEAFRAAIVFSWVGAVSLLQSCIARNHLADFNAEAKRRDPKWRDAKTIDDLGRMRESEFLDILQALSIISRNVKQELEERLRLRNSCGHPTTLEVAGRQAIAHVDSLILNVFARF